MKWGMAERVGRATVRVRVTIDVVADGRLVTADRWVTLGDRHPLLDVEQGALVAAARDTAAKAEYDALEALREKLGES